MKKIILSAIVVGLMVAPFQAFAAAEYDSINTGDRSEIAFSKSNNVTLLYGDDDESSPQGYAVIAKHLAGNRYFGATDRSNPVFVQLEACKGATVLATVTDCTLPAITEFIDGTDSNNTEIMTETTSAVGPTWSAL